MPAADPARREILDAATEVRERLVRFVRRRVGDAHDAEDLVQSVFVRLQENVDRLDHPGRVVPWLFQVTRNALADHYRTESRRTEALDALAPERPGELSGSTYDPPTGSSRRACAPSSPTSPTTTGRRSNSSNSTATPRPKRRRWRISRSPA